MAAELPFAHNNRFITKNNENKTAFELVRNDDIKNYFKMYLTEKSLLDAENTTPGQNREVNRTLSFHL